MDVSQYIEGLGYMPCAPCPFYVWELWKWQKVRCDCGKTFVSRDLGLMPREYEAHWMLTHGN
jgi:hypothetical protein